MGRLSDSAIDEALQRLKGWRRQGNAIERVFEFPSFMPAIDFVNQVARAAEEAQHHPDITINYNKVTMALSSHDSGGVTERDVKMAERISQLG